MVDESESEKESDCVVSQEFIESGCHLQSVSKFSGHLN